MFSIRQVDEDRLAEGSQTGFSLLQVIHVFVLQFNVGRQNFNLKQSADFQSAPVAVINIGRSTIFGAVNPGNWSVAKKVEEEPG